MGKKREVRDTNPNPVSQFNDLIAGYNTRDISGRPLGDVRGHSVARLRTCYGILHAARLAVQSATMQIENEVRLEVSPAGEPPQDRKHTHDYPAAHLAPCKLIITRGWALRPNIALFLIYRNGIARSYTRSLFETTDIVNVLTNKADTYCEGFSRSDKFGTAHELARCANLVMSDYKLSVRDVFFRELVPGFRRVALDRLDARSEQLDSMYPGHGDISPLVDQFGKLYAAPAMVTDHRLGSTSATAQQTNYQATVQILELYANSPTPPLHELDRIQAAFHTLHNDEMATIIRGD